MYRFVLLLFLSIPLIGFSESTINNNYPYYFKAEVQEGEGLHALLRRYAVNNACNINEFYRLNNLNKKDYLIAGKEYFLPVQIYQYDGRSIRSTIKITEWERAVKIKEYNEHILSKGLRRTHYADSKILWVPHHLIACYTLEEVLEEKNKIGQKIVIDSDNVVQPTKKISKNIEIDHIFGKEYSEIEVVDRSLKNKVYYIVSGHGGPDPGAMCTSCPSTLCEDEYAYDVALRLARNLRQHGAQVEIIIQDQNDGIRDDKYLECDKDEKCNNKRLPLNQKKRLNQRTVHINSLYKKYKSQGYKEHMCIVLHVDAAGTSARKDVFFYHHKNSKTGKRAANNIHETFKKKYDIHQKGRGYKGTVKSRGLYLINYTHPPVVFIELANIKNPADQKRILLPSNRQALANWLFEGLIAN